MVLRPGGAKGAFSSRSDLKSSGFQDAKILACTDSDEKAGHRLGAVANTCGPRYAKNVQYMHNVQNNIQHNMQINMHMQ